MPGRDGSIWASTEQLLEAAPDGVVIIDGGGLIRFVDRNAQVLFGYGTEELIGRSLTMLVEGGPAGGDLVGVKPAVDGPLVDDPEGRQVAARRKDGSSFPARLMLSSLSAGGPSLVLAAFRAAVERSGDATFEGLLKAAPDAMVAVSRSGLIHLVNRQAEALFGYRRDELMGAPVDILVPDRLRDAHPGHRSGYFHNPRPRPMGAGRQLTARRKNGSGFPVDISLSSLETPDGVLVTAAVRDVTDRRRADEDRARLERRLFEARRDEERAVLEARLEGARRLEGIGRLAGGVAREFDELIGGIVQGAVAARAGLDALVDDRDLAHDPGAAEVARRVDEIGEVASRAAHITRQLLIFGHGEVVRPALVDLNAIASELGALAGRAFGEAVGSRPRWPRTCPGSRPTAPRSNRSC